jgi:hypothetical protein
MLQQQQNSAGQSPSQTLAGLGFPGASGLTPVWVIYTQLDPLNVTALLASLTQACGGLPWQGGLDVASQPCGVATVKALRRAGLKVDDLTYQQMLIGKPVVSVALLLGLIVLCNMIAFCFHRSSRTKAATEVVQSETRRKCRRSLTVSQSWGQWCVSKCSSVRSVDVGFDCPCYCSHAQKVAKQGDKGKCRLVDAC